MSDILIIEIEPACCRPWKYHNRDWAWLTQEKCADLISSIKQNGQSEPVLVRKTVEDQEYKYELIYGVRRWFACSQIPNQKLIARVTDKDDKKCMVLMHAENACSKDISEFERAFSFAEQMKSGMFKNQTEMAENMGLTQGTISKMIKSAEIFEYPWIRSLFQNKLEISVKDAYILSTLLKERENYTKIKKAADEISREIEETQHYPSAKFILKKLITIIRPELGMLGTSIISGMGNKPLISYKRNKVGTFSIFIENEAKHLNRAELEAACFKAIDIFLNYS